MISFLFLLFFFGTPCCGLHSLSIFPVGTTLNYRSLFLLHQNTVRGKGVPYVIESLKFRSSRALTTFKMIKNCLLPEKALRFRGFLTYFEASRFSFYFFVHFHLGIANGKKKVLKKTGIEEKKGVDRYTSIQVVSESQLIR